MNPRRPRTHALLAVTAVALLTLTGCARGASPQSSGETSSPGITDDAVQLGISGPLSGPAAGVGSCSIAGLYAYVEAKNAAGGFEFGDGKTRRAELTYLDDAYDPSKAVANFTQLEGQGMFAYTGALGTPTNAAILPLATEDEVPQVLLQTGASEFSDDPDAHPWTTGLLPTYYDEAKTFGEMLVATGLPLTVAILSQNDDYGEGYVDGLTDAIEGSAVKIVSTATYEPTDVSVDGQLTQLAGSNADVFVSAVSVTPLQIGALTKAQSLGWLPRIFLPSNSATPATVVIPGSGQNYPAIYTTALSKVPASPAFADDPDVQEYNAAFEEYGTKITTSYTPQCAWGWIVGSVLAEAFAKMEAPTRASFMTALSSISDFQAPLLLDGVTVDTTQKGKPAISSANLVQFSGEGYVPFTSY